MGLAMGGFGRCGWHDRVQVYVTGNHRFCGEALKSLCLHGCTLSPHSPQTDQINLVATDRYPRFNANLPNRSDKIGNNMVECEFHPFPRLPTEIRLQIWEMLVEPRTVELYCNHNEYSRVLKTFSPTPASPTLHVCRESRGHISGLYQQILFQEAFHCGISDANTQQYLWLNWDIDTVSIGKSYLSCFESIAPLIRKLRVKRDNGEEWWCRWESQSLRIFRNVKTIHVECLGGDQESWHASSEDYPWPCGPENVFIVDRNQTMRLTDVDTSMIDSMKQLLEKKILIVKYNFTMSDDQDNTQKGDSPPLSN